MSRDCEEYILPKTLKHCYYRFPLLIEVIGVSLLYQERSWTGEKTILDNPQPTVLECLQPRLNVLIPHLKDCFLDIGSFLEDQKIHAWSIIDIWVELYGKGSTVYGKYLNELAFLNLLNLVPLGGSDQLQGDWLRNIPFWRNEQEDGFYNEFLVTQHSILRDLAICQSKSEEHQERIRLNLEIREDKFPDWCLDLMQPINTRLLSISTDDLFSSTWVEMDCPNVEALILNLSSSNYALPNFIATMKKLKAVIVINQGIAPAKLTNLSCLSSLPNLKRIRFEKISVSWLDILLSRLGSLEKLSLSMCSFDEVFYDVEEIAIPSLQEINIDFCYDLDELPDWVSEVVSLKKLSITKCKKLSLLPKAIGNLSKLQVLRLSSCISLSELPESIVRLSNLQFLDISVCLALKKLPLMIGKLRKLEKISMRMCSVCELPDSVKDFENLEVECDGETETAWLWQELKPKMKSLGVKERWEYSDDF